VFDTFADPVQNIPAPAGQPIDAAVEAWRSDSPAPAVSMAVIFSKRLRLAIIITTGRGGEAPLTFGSVIRTRLMLRL
jgi:hypothetical protein